MKCSKCQEEKSLEEMSIRNKNEIKIYKKYKTYCKKCSSNLTKEWRNKNPDKVKKLNKIAYEKIKISIDNNIDYAINYWCDHWINRSGNQFYSRKNINKNHLIALCQNALKIYPYLKFQQNKEKWETPSVDRIDSSKPYTNDNITVIPLWLNSAKLDMDINQLHKLIKHYIDINQLLS